MYEDTLQSAKSGQSATSLEDSILWLMYNEERECLCLEILRLKKEDVDGLWTWAFQYYVGIAASGLWPP